MTEPIESVIRDGATALGMSIDSMRQATVAAINMAEATRSLAEVAQPFLKSLAQQQRSAEAAQRVERMLKRLRRDRVIR